MGAKVRRTNQKKQTVCIGKEMRKIGFILVVFGLVTICAFFLPIKAWILLLGVVLIYCGYQMYRVFR